jgi:SRSO17 transposase
MLGNARGRTVEPVRLRRVFRLRQQTRQGRQQGQIRLHHVGLSIDQGLWGQTAEVWLYDEAVRVEQDEHLPVSYPCVYDTRQRRITAVDGTGRQQSHRVPVVQLMLWLLHRALWNPEAVCGELRRSVLHHLADPNAVLVLDETGLLKKGRHSAGVARQYSGTAGRVENCQMGVLLGCASQLGHALLDRELYLPQEWTDDRDRCQPAGIPEGQRFATKPQLARQLLPRALAAGRPAKWVTGDSVYGDDRRLRLGLEAQPQAYVLGASAKAYGWLNWRQRQVKTILATPPEDGGTRLSAGDGEQGPRRYDGCGLPLADPPDPRWRGWLLVRRRVSDPIELRGYVALAPQGTTLAEVVPVAGTRWVIEQLCEAATGKVGLDHYEVRSWTGWYRHITLALWAVLRAGTIAVEALKKSLPRGQISPVWRHSGPPGSSHPAESRGDTAPLVALGLGCPADRPA